MRQFLKMLLFFWCYWNSLCTQASCLAEFLSVWLWCFLMIRLSQLFFSLLGYNIVMSFLFLCSIPENIGSQTNRLNSLSLVLSLVTVKVVSTRFLHGKGTSFPAINSHSLGWRCETMWISYSSSFSQWFYYPLIILVWCKYYDHFTILIFFKLLYLFYNLVVISL